MSNSNLLNNLSEPINSLFNPVAKKAGGTLADIWDIIFGGVSYFAQKTNMKRQQNLNEFAQSIANKINEIPTDEIKEPRLKIVGPVLECSKYYFEEPEIREMFAKLIAASMDNRKTNKVRTAYTDIIQQLEPLDAEILSRIYSSPLSKYPAVRLKLQRGSENASYTVYNHIIKDFSTIDNVQLVTASIDNLERLGLIESHYDTWFADLSNYNWTENHPLYEKARSFRTSELNTLEDVKGMVLCTQFGKDFTEICLFK